MSYDIFFFDPASAPRDHAAFLQWFENETESDEYSVEPDICTPSLIAFYRDLATTFFPLNGSGAPPDIEDRAADAGDYTFRPTSIHASFAWSRAVEAGQLGMRYAERHSIGLFDLASETGDVYWPGNAGMEIVSNRKRTGFFKRLFRKQK